MRLLMFSAAFYYSVVPCYLVPKIMCQGDATLGKRGLDSGSLVLRHIVRDQLRHVPAHGP
jgi:hypothetical protein